MNVSNLKPVLKALNRETSQTAMIRTPVNQFWKGNQSNSFERETSQTVLKGHQSVGKWWTRQLVYDSVVDVKPKLITGLRLRRNMTVMVLYKVLKHDFLKYNTWR